MTLRVVLVSLLICTLMLACSHPSDTNNQPRILSLTATDGTHLVATYYPVEQSKPPGLVLIHMSGSNRQSWSRFAQDAQRDGIASIAIDLRGHGDSTTDRRLDYRNFMTSDWSKTLNDIDAAKHALLANGINPENIARVGADIGANLALRYAVDHTDIQAVVMLSPGLNYHGINAETDVVAYGKRPILLMTTDGDSYSASSCPVLKEKAVGQCELREYAGSSHGTDILDAVDLASGQILLWLAPIIGHGSASLPDMS